MDSKRLHVVIISITLYEVSFLLVHFHQIVLQSLIHTINNTNSTPLINGSTRNVNMKNQQWNRKRMDCSMWTQFMNSNEELDKRHKVDSDSPISPLPHEESTRWIFIVPLIPIHLWLFWQWQTPFTPIRRNGWKGKYHVRECHPSSANTNLFGSLNDLWQFNIPLPNEYSRIM